MADVKWIKICTDIFDDEKILLIESLPSADSIIVIWFKLLTLAGKKNNGGVFTITESMPYTDEMFATIFRRDVNVVRLALDTFKGFGMIDIIDNTVTIPKWNDHQSLKEMTSRQQYMKEYMAKKRANEKALKAAQKAEENLEKDDVNINVNVNNVNSVNTCKHFVNSLEENRREEKREEENIHHPPLPPLVNKPTTEVEVTDDDDEDKNPNASLSEIFKVLEQNVGMIAPLFAEKVKALYEEVGFAATMYGIKTAILNNRRNFGYVDACARNFVNGIEVAPKKKSAGSQMSIDESVARAKEALARMRREDDE